MSNLSKLNIKKTGILADGKEIQTGDLIGFWTITDDKYDSEIFVEGVVIEQNNLFFIKATGKSRYTSLPKRYKDKLIKLDEADHITAQTEIFKRGL